jgi:hypothetical protein
LDSIGKIRQEKSLNKKAMNSEIYLTLDRVTYDNLKEFLEDLKSVMNIKEINQDEKFKVEFV